jgi:hypothetical protein
MYHRMCKQMLRRQILVLALLCLAVPTVPAMAVAADAQHISNNNRNVVGNLPVNVKELKKRPQNFEYFQLDNSPLGNRCPLLMVHGVRGEFWPDCFRWQKLCNYLNQNDEFRQQFKIYFARYDSYAPLPQLVRQFRSSVADFSDAVSGKPISIIALSMGGNVVAESLADKSTDTRVSRVLTMGTPFHGSPLFTANWMQYSMLKSHIMPPTQLDTCLPYQIFFSKHNNLLANLNWDNSDKLLPTVNHFRLWFEPIGTHDISAEATANKTVFRLNENDHIDKSKFIVYGGFLDDYQGSGLGHSLSWFVKTILPEHTGNEHAVLRSLNRQMRYIVTAKTRDGERIGKHGLSTSYQLNDGITPLSSSLFLPNALNAGMIVASDRDLKNLRGRTDVHRARVFRNADHLTFINAYRPAGAATDMRDELEPEHQAQPIFAWIMSDILQDKRVDELAAEQQRKTP